MTPNLHPIHQLLGLWLEHAEVHHVPFVAALLSAADLHVVVLLSLDHLDLLDW
jgi:hypothetical protein